MNLPSGYWHEWVEAMDKGLVGVPSTLRLVVIGSERVEPTRVASWRRHVGDRPALLHAYGVSEATITSLTHRIEDETIVLGLPITNVQAEVVDDHGDQVPVGVAGELWLAGKGLARGYLNQPGLTGERFVNRDGRRFYRSGDRVRRRADGALEFLGRLDQQIKLGGLRIEPGGVENQLTAHPEVRAAAVAVRGGNLVAYVTGDAQPDRLGDYLPRPVPAWMVPSHIEVLDTMPLTANGKIDRRSLPEPTARPRRGRTPIGNLERLIASVWQEVLGVTDVGVYDNFFDLGGRSLLLVRPGPTHSSSQKGDLHARIVPPAYHPCSRRSPRAGIPMNAPSDDARPLAARLEALSPSRRVVVERLLRERQRQGGLVPRSVRDDLVTASFGQRRLWFMAQLDESSSVYNTVSSVLLPTPVDVAALQGAVDALVARHESLRSNIRSGGWGAIPAGECIRGGFG